MTSFLKFCRIEIVCADIPLLLEQISISGVQLYAIEWVDPLTVNATIAFGHLKRTERILAKNGATFKTIRREGMAWKFGTILMRPVLFWGLLLFFAVALLIPKHILFVEVIGNQSVSSQDILASVEQLGIKFGTSASNIRSEELKNRLLQRIPQLQWVGITTRGCVAEIQVKERNVKQTDHSQTGVVSSIIAACDGVITEQTVSSGNPLFQVGDAVNKGDTLVSGYIDCGIKLQTVQANAEIYAYTTRENTYLSPLPVAYRGKFKQKHTCYKLRIGKKVINFCNHSGIMDSGCVKMYSEDYWSLPGGFQLPVSLISITHSYFENGQSPLDDSHCEWASQFARDYLASQMISGKILNEKFRMEELEDMKIFTCTYTCHEMIGREKYEGTME